MRVTVWLIKEDHEVESVMVFDRALTDREIILEADRLRKTLGVEGMKVNSSGNNWYVTYTTSKDPLVDEDGAYLDPYRISYEVHIRDAQTFVGLS